MTQKQQIIEILNRQGYIDNFYSISNKISIRLGARIQDLEADGWIFRTEKQGKNYFYHVVSKPPDHPCCVWNGKNGTHASNCPKNEINYVKDGLNGLF